RLPAGHAVWELYCLEHGVQADGRAGPETAESAFSRNGNRFTPRAVMCDTDPTVIDEVRHGAYRQLFAPDCLISHKEGAAGNYAVGRNAVGRAILPQVSQAVRRQAEAATRLEGLILYHSYGGARVRLHAAAHGEPAQQLRQEDAAADGRVPFTKSELLSSHEILLIWLAFNLYSHGYRIGLISDAEPCLMARLATGTVEPYNTVACLQACEPLSNGVILLDNEAIDYTRANRLCAQLISSLYRRFPVQREQNATLADISTNLIPTRLHLPVAFVRADEAVQATWSPATSEPHLSSW
uniref:Tubulin domain-containing protein n=1 Tax=Macrostomum lignano TaxID=282301 RepID=A0A1I8FQP2_9PLAT